MSLTKDGFYKSFSGAIGNNNYLLEAGGGHIGWGNAANQIPYSNGTVNTSLNADMTDGLHVHSGRNNEANKIVRTDGSGYIQAGYINTNVSTEDGLSWSRVFFEYNNDGYIRKASISRAKTVFFGGQVGSPSVPIYWTGSAFATCIVSFGNSSYGEHNANNINDNGIKYYTSNGPSTSLGASTGDGALYSQAYSTSWVAQIAQDYRNGGLYVRGKNNGTWQSWYRVWDNRTTYVSGGKGYIGGTEITQVNNADTVDSMHANEFVPKRHTARFYPFVNSSYGQPWYKITLPWAGYTSGSNAWMMTTMEIVLGGSYSSGNNGRIYLQYYFYKNSSNGWGASDVRGTCIGYRLIENGVTIKYDIANPGIFYIKANANTYNSIGLENITANDTAPSFDFRNTTIEAIAESSVPSAANQTVPLYHTITTQNGYWANLAIQTSPSTSTSPTVSTIYASNWFRSTGATGWYSESYGGGIWMTDSSWIRTYGSKHFYVEGGNFAVSGSAGIGTTSPSYKLHVAGSTYITDYLGVGTVPDSTYGRLVFPENNIAIGFRKNGSYKTSVQYMTTGNEALVFSTQQAVTSFIFKCGHAASNGSDWQSGVIGTPSVQIKQQSLYVNGYIANGSSPSYNLYVGGTAYISGQHYAAGYHHNSVDSDNYVLLAGGGYEAKSNFYRNLDGSYLRYSGWWNSGSGQSVDNASGMIFAYDNHGVPGSWGIVATFDYQLDSSYRLQLYGDGWNSNIYYRVRSSDRGGWYGGWKHIYDDGYHPLADKLTITGYQSDGLSFYQTSSAFDESNEYFNSWAHYIIANHGDGSSYYHYSIALPFWSWPRYKRQTGSVSSHTQWYSFVTEENIGNYYWANLSVQKSSNAYTVPSFAAIKIRNSSPSYHSADNIISGTAGEIYFAGNFHIDSRGSNKLYLNHYTSNSIAMVTGGGNVGIGTDSPSYGLTLATNKRLYIYGNESNAIYTEYHGNSHISTNSPESNAAIRHGFIFQWYNTYWKIGNVRGGGVNSAGFGIAYSGGAQLSLLVKPDLCGTNIYGKTANSDSNAALRVIKGWDCGNRAGYDTMIISSNDCTSLRLIESDGTSTGISAGDGKSVIATTHYLQFYTGASNTTTPIYYGMGGTEVVRISSQKLTMFAGQQNRDYSISGSTVIDLTNYTTWVPSSITYKYSSGRCVLFFPIPSSELLGSIIYIHRIYIGDWLGTVRNPSYPSINNAETIWDNAERYCHSTEYIMGSSGDSMRWMAESGGYKDNAVFYRCEYDYRLGRYFWREHWTGGSAA